MQARCSGEKLHTFTGDEQNITALGKFGVTFVDFTL